MKKKFKYFKFIDKKYKWECFIYKWECFIDDILKIYKMKMV